MAFFTADPDFETQAARCHAWYVNDTIPVV
jgi:hypothetical protein